jgi:hypothetical protein
MGLDFDQLFPNRFLKAGEFAGKDVTLTIASVKVEVLVGDKGEESKGIVGFKETTKQLVLNKTNGLCIKGMFGRDTGNWLGKRVTLYPAKIDFGDSEIAIRVRGSPDIAADTDVEVKLARKKPRTVKMYKTGQKQQAKPAPKQAQPPKPPPPPEPQAEDSEMPPDFEEPPPFDPVTGEVLA